MFKRAFPLRSLALSAMASAVLAGCVNLAPEYTAPASPVPQALPSSGVEASSPCWPTATCPPPASRRRRRST